MKVRAFEMAATLLPMRQSMRSSEIRSNGVLRNVELTVDCSEIIQSKLHLESQRGPYSESVVEGDYRRIHRGRSRIDPAKLSRERESVRGETNKGKKTNQILVDVLLQSRHNGVRVTRILDTRRIHVPVDRGEYLGAESSQSTTRLLLNLISNRSFQQSQLDLDDDQSDDADDEEGDGGGMEDVRAEPARRRLPSLRPISRDFGEEK